MTPLAIRMSRRRNGVSRLHGEVARAMWRPMFPDADRARPDHARHERRAPADLGRDADARRCSTQPPRRRLARAAAGPAVVGGGARDPERRALGGPLRVAAAARRVRPRRRASRTACCAASRSTTSALIESSLDPDALTIGFARRLATYKRFHLLSHDPDRARRIFTRRPAGAARDRRQGAPERRGRGRTRSSASTTSSATTPQIAGRVVIVEDYDLGVARAPRLRLRRLAQPAAQADGGERHERHEGDLQRRAPAQRARRLVGRGLRRRRTAGRSPATRDERPERRRRRRRRALLRPARARGDPALLRPRRGRRPAAAGASGSSEALVTLRAEVQRHAHGQRLRRADLPRDCRLARRGAARCSASRWCWRAARASASGR